MTTLMYKQIGISPCVIDDADEPVFSDSFRICFECGHVYNLKMDIVNQDLQSQIKNELLLTDEVQVRSVLDITYCPLCLHDW